MERTKWSQKVRFGADRGDGAAPLSCEVAWWIHGAPARLWVPPHLKSGTLCCKRWPCSLLMLVREKRWFWGSSVCELASCVSCARNRTTAPRRVVLFVSESRLPMARSAQGRHCVCRSSCAVLRADVNARKRDEKAWNHAANLETKTAPCTPNAFHKRPCGAARRGGAVSCA